MESPASSPTNLLPSLVDVGVDVPPEEASIGASPTEQFYVAHNRSVLALAVLCLGLRDSDGNLMLDPAEKPWKSMKKKTVNPSTTDMKAEIQRRWETFGGLGEKPPSSKYWDKKQLEKWLSEHPITGVDDVSFLRKVIADLKESAENAKKDEEWESEQINAATEKKYKKWSGNKVYQRMMHAIVDFAEIKRAYIHRDDAPSGRMAIENRKTKEAIERIVWSMIATKWNDPDWDCDTEAPEDLHPDFMVSETITHKDVAEYIPLTAERAKERFESIMTQLKRTIPKWEKSGQGDRGHEGDDNDEIQPNTEEGENHSSSSSSSSSSSGIISTSQREQPNKPKWGEFKNRSRFSILKLRDFFKGTNSYVLYCWYVIQKHDLITCSMNMLSEGVCSRDGARGIPSVITRRSEVEDDDISDDTDGRSASDTSKSMSNSSRSTKRKGRSNDDEEGDRLGTSIRDHGSKLVEYAKINAGESKRNRDHAELQAKRQRIDDINAAIDKLKAEKRGFLIQLVSIPKGTNSPLEEAYQSSINEIDEQIKVKEASKEDTIDVPTPIRNNRTPT